MNTKLGWSRAYLRKTKQELIDMLVNCQQQLAHAKEDTEVAENSLALRTKERDEAKRAAVRHEAAYNEAEKERCANVLEAIRLRTEKANQTESMTDLYFRYEEMRRAGMQGREMLRLLEKQVLTLGTHGDIGKIAADLMLATLQEVDRCLPSALRQERPIRNEKAMLDAVFQQNGYDSKHTTARRQED